MEKSKNYKVVFIHPDLGIGGAERLVLDVAVALADERNEVSFVTNHFDRTHAFEELRDNEFPVRTVGDWIPRSICGICQALCAYIRMIYLALVYILFIRKEDKPDVYFIDQIPMAVPFIKWAGGKVVYYCHHPDLLASSPGGTLKKLYRLPINWLEYKGTAMADVLLVNSKYTASVFHKTFPEITKDIQILYPTISSSYQSTISNNTKRKPIQDLVPEIQTSKDSVIFLSINRYHPAKKLELALNGLEALKSKLSPNDWNRVHLIIAGGYDPQSSINATYFSKLVEVCQAKNLIMKVTFLKSPSDNLKADLLLACDCLIYTPINEHFGIVPLEAMTASKPVIACNSGGPCETVQHEVTGYLCDPTPDSLADAMSKMLDKSTSHKMGILGKERLEKYFSHATFTSCVNNAVNKLLNTEPVVEPAVNRNSVSFVEKQCRIPVLKDINATAVPKNSDILENQKVEELIVKQEVKPDSKTSSTDETESNSNMSSVSPNEACYLTPNVSSKGNSEISTTETCDLSPSDPSVSSTTDMCYLSPSNFSMAHSDLNTSVVSSTETCYMSPLNTSKVNTELDVSNDTNTDNQSLEIADEAVPAGQ